MLDKASGVSLRQAASKQVVESDKPQAKSPRVFGLHAGMGEIHEGFEDPLPDEFWTESL